jgi:serine/threonine protein kinase
MIGGGMIAEGGFGCVFHPALQCSEKNDVLDETEYISKIVKRDFSSENEMKISKKIRSMVFQTSLEWSDFFNVAVEECDMDISKIESKEKNKCESFSRYPNAMFINLKMPYIEGKTLSDHLKDDSLTDKSRFQTFQRGYIQLLISLEKLITAGVVHNDIKSGNIIFSEEKEKPIIIDFGLSFIVDKDSGLYPIKSLDEKLYKKYFYVYAPDYYIWAPEIHLLNYLIHNNPYPDKDKIEQIAHEIVLQNPIFQKYFSVDFRHQYKKSLITQFTQLINCFPTTSVGRLGLLNKIIASSWETWDNFSLSMFYIKFLAFSHGKKEFFKNKYVEKLLEILLINISPISNSRVSPKKSRRSFQDWLIDGGPDVFSAITDHVNNIGGKNAKLYRKSIANNSIKMQALSRNLVRKKGKVFKKKR